MGARTGREFVEDLRNAPRDVYIEGEHVRDVTRHPRLRGIVRTLAELYDMQHDPALRDDMTYPSPATGERVGMSFLTPRTGDDLVRRRRMMERWAGHTLGMMGRSPDYLNASFMAFAAARSFFAQNDPAYGENVARYYERVRDHDLCLTHTLIAPQVNRAVGPAQQADPTIVARIVRETDAGIVISGGRMLATLGPVADEIAVFPSTVLRGQPGSEDYAFAFAIPCDTPGLRFLCREGFDLGRGIDHPLASRFEEMDAVVAFDNVLVPWERVFLARDVDLCNDVYGETHAVIHMAHQVVVKNIAKSEFFLGLVSLLAETIGITQFQHVQEKIAEVITYHESMKALLRAAEVDAALDVYGVMCPARPPLDVARNLFPRMYPRIVEIVQLLGASGLMALPTEADMVGEAAADIAKYLQARTAPARERVRLFRLAWDASLSAFGSRQVLYERFFFGDPVRMMSALYNVYDKEPAMERVRAFLERAAAGGAEEGPA
ncbi:MAG: 4-hydroxyphenylacetate 3-monooxygenase, oxygenase component [Firmicutes bacterium]|nr:4-hydroxyphenylacetate 3-monooxygenase, oxygenase component [Bacillota bacterium]